MSPDYWPRSRIPKSRGNAFDLSLPGLIDWSVFHRRASSAKKRDALADLPAAQQPSRRARGTRHLHRARG